MNRKRKNSMEKTGRDIVPVFPDFGGFSRHLDYPETIFSCFRASGTLPDQIWIGRALFTARTELGNFLLLGGALSWIWMHFSPVWLMKSRNYGTGPPCNTCWRDILASFGFGWWNCVIIRALRQKCWCGVLASPNLEWGNRENFLTCYIVCWRGPMPHCW